MTRPQSFSPAIRALAAQVRSTAASCAARSAGQAPQAIFPANQRLVGCCRASRRAAECPLVPLLAREWDLDRSTVRASYAKTLIRTGCHTDKAHGGHKDRIDSVCAAAASAARDLFADLGCAFASRDCSSSSLRRVRTIIAARDHACAAAVVACQSQAAARYVDALKQRTEQLQTLAVRCRLARCRPVRTATTSRASLRRLVDVPSEELIR